MTVSIIGDSISTYSGYNPSGYAVYYDNETRKKNGIETVNQTWWAKVIKYLNAELCVNNSYSGSKVTGTTFPSATSKERINGLCNSTIIPSLILIYIGLNDYGYGVKLERRFTEKLKKSDLNVFSDAYDYMISEIKHRYPDSKIVCGTLMRTQIKNYHDWVFPEFCFDNSFEEFNNVIRKTSHKQKCLLADLSALDMRYETLDGTHPTVVGHELISKAWVNCFTETF